MILTLEERLAVVAELDRSLRGVNHPDLVTWRFPDDVIPGAVDPRDPEVAIVERTI